MGYIGSCVVVSVLAGSVMSGLAMGMVQDCDPARMFARPVVEVDRARDVLVADLDGDGLDDLVSLIDPNAGVGLEVRLGKDGLGAPVGYGSFVSIDGDIGDADGDGDLDIVVYSYVEDGIYTYLNNGDGTFAAPVGSQVGLLGWNVQELLLGDMDGDGAMDVVLRLFSSPYGAAVCLNDGSGLFGTAVATGSGLYAGDSELGDFDDDGDLDVLIAGEINSFDMVVLENDGLGGLTRVETDVSSSQNSGLVAVSDIDGDGDMDIAIKGGSGGRVHRNDGGGVYTEIFSFPMSAGSDELDWRDVDGDGDVDLVHVLEPRVSWYENLGSGMFGPEMVVRAGSLVRHGVFVEPGRVDIAFVSDDTMGVLESIGGGAYDQPEVVDEGWDYVGSILVFDVDNNGYRDVLLGFSDFGFEFAHTRYYDGSGFTHALELSTGSFGPYEPAQIRNSVRKDFVTMSGDQIYTLKNTGTGGLAIWRTMSTGSDSISTPKIVDFDSDGYDDIINLNHTNDGIDTRRNLRQTGFNEGRFGAPMTHDLGIDAPWSLWVGDLNGDGIVDAIITTRRLGSGADPDELVVVLGNPDGSFSTAQSFETDGSNTTVRVGDVDNDGDLDVLHATGTDTILRVLVNDGSGAFVLQTQDVGFETNRFELGDLDNDGVLDLVSLDFQTSSFFVMTGDGLGGFVRAGRYDHGLEAASLALGDVNSDSMLDVLIGSTNTATNAELMTFIQRCVEVEGCDPDLTGDGALDFFDLSELLTSQLDYNGDTSFDFFDLSAFLTDFGEGCP